MRRLMGGVMSDSTAQNWPALSQEVANAEINMPAESQATNRVFEMGPISRTLYPDTYAMTGPLGTIGFNRQLIEQDKQNLGDVVTHELTHVGQGMRGFNRYIPGGRQELENEAVNAEAMRPIRREDVYLPPENGVDVSPTQKKVVKGR
jgi:hypothetical protein